MKIFTDKQIVVAVSSDCPTEKGQKMAHDLQLPFVENPRDYPWVLIQSADKLALQFPGAAKPFYVDFSETRYYQRVKKATRSNTPLARAVGLKSADLHVVDGTLGFGADAVLLATLGAKMTVVERSPIVAALFADGWRRAQELPLYAGAEIKLVVMNTENYLNQLTEMPDVIYLDPMFPERSHQALVKKPLQLLQSLFADEILDVPTFIKKALPYAKQRVVVKRPKWAKPYIKSPNFSIPAGIIHFDGYLQDIK